MGCQIVDTTCGDVMRVWKRVRNHSKQGFTSLIHGKADHEETRATASRAYDDFGGHYIVILTIEDCEYVCNYIENGGDKAEFLNKFEGSFSPDFDPINLSMIGVANQTTMLKGETEEFSKSFMSQLNEEMVKGLMKISSFLIRFVEQLKNDKMHFLKCSKRRWICH